MRLVTICEDGSRLMVWLTSLLKTLCQTSKARRSDTTARGIVITAKAEIRRVLHCASGIVQELLRLCSWCSFLRRLQSLHQVDR